MKIEKINDNQIRCTLNKHDLASRQIKLSELAYGTEKARALFRDMMKQASHEYGFEVDDQPLMIEAIPVSTDSIILNISKVSNPDELDTRFSKFAPMFGELDDIGDDEDALEELANSFDEALDFLASDEESEESGFMSLSELFSNRIAQAKKQRREEKPLELMGDIAIFKYSDLALLEKAADVLKNDYIGVNTLYKDSKNKVYYLVLNGADRTFDNFNKICNILNEYGTREIFTNLRESFFKEHFAVMIKNNALQMLSTIS